MGSLFVRVAVNRRSFYGLMITPESANGAIYGLRLSPRRMTYPLTFPTVYDWLGGVLIALIIYGLALLFLEWMQGVYEPLE